MSVKVIAGLMAAAALVIGVVLATRMRQRASDTLAGGDLVATGRG